MEREKPNARAEERKVTEADTDSFPASDPPAWTAARSGGPEPNEQKAARHAESGNGRERRCEAIALFAQKADADRAADALLTAGFAQVDVGPPRCHGDLSKGIGTPDEPGRDPLACAAAGAVALGLVAALIGGRRGTALALAGTGGLAAAIAAPSRRRKVAAGAEWPEAGACLLRVRVDSAEDERRALLVAQSHGARAIHVRWA
ncbi:MAG: hypothetical protein KIT16_05915 [Rhodospirillaceae bacterium]|nr:hypothetical protein [Rhodospirillaceae bacterium]